MSSARGPTVTPMAMASTTGLSAYFLTILDDSPRVTTAMPTSRNARSAVSTVVLCPARGAGTRVCRCDTVDFVDTKRHYCQVRTDVKPSGIVPVPFAREESVRPGHTPLH